MEIPGLIGGAVDDRGGGARCSAAKPLFDVEKFDESFFVHRHDRVVGARDAKIYVGAQIRSSSSGR